MTLKEEIKAFSEKSPITLKDIILLAKAVQREEEHAPRQLVARTRAEGVSLDEKKHAVVEPIPEIEQAKLMLFKALLPYRVEHGTKLQAELEKYYIDKDKHIFGRRWGAAAQTKKIIDTIISKVDVEIAARASKRAVDKFEARLVRATGSLTRLLTTPPYNDFDSLVGVIEVQDEIKQLKSLISHPKFNEAESKDGILDIFAKGNRRLYLYAERYIAHLVKIDRPSSLYIEDVSIAKDTVAAIIQFLFENNSEEEALKYLRMLIQSARSKEAIAQLYDICLYRVSNPPIQKEFLNILNQEFVANSGLQTAYEIFSTHSNEAIRISLARVILSCEGIGTDEAKKIAELKEEQLMQLAGVLGPAEAMNYIAKNENIAEEVRRRLASNLQDDSALKLQKYVAKKTTNFMRAIQENRGDFFVVAVNESNDLLRAVNAELDRDKDKKTNVKPIILAGMGDAVRETKISYLNCMQITAEALKHAASSLEGSRHAKLSAREREDSKVQTLMLGPGAGLASRMAMRHIESTLVDKAGLIKIIHNFMGVLIELNPKDAVENIESIFDVLLLEDEEKERKSIHMTERVQAACDICLGQENAKARFASGKALLEGHCANLTDHQIDELIEALVRIEPDKHKIYSIFLAQSQEDRVTMAAAMLRNPSMRAWVISSGGSVYDNIFSSLKNYFIDAPDPRLEQIRNRDEYEAALAEDKQRRAAAIDDAKKLFANWTNEDFDQAVLKDTAKKAGWLHWGSLTRPNAGDLSEPKLKAEVQKLDLTQLSIAQIKALDKRSRIAILKNLGPWEEGSQKITRTIPFNPNRFKVKADALTAGFTAEDIEELNGCETGLIVAFKNFPEEAARQIIAGPYPQRKAGWIVLQELDHGFYKGAERGRFFGNQGWLHDLIVTSIYRYQKADGYLVDGLLERNLLVEADLRKRKAAFLADRRTSVDAYKLILHSPRIIMKYKNTTTITQDFLNGIKAALGVEAITGVENELDAFVVSAATPCFGRPQCVSPRAFLGSIQTLRNAGEGTNEFKAGKLLIDTIPLFLRYNHKYTSDDIEAMKELCDLYRENNENSNILNKNKDSAHYNEDRLVAALEGNQYPGAGSAARNVLGYVLFSHPFVDPESKAPTKPDYILLKGYLNKQHAYEIPESPVISWLRTFVWGLTIGALTGLAVAIYAHFTAGFNPANWFQRESIGDKLIGLAKVAIGGAAAAATGLGIGATAAGFIAAAVVGGVALGVLFVTGRAAWEGIKRGATRFGNWVRHLRGLEIIREGQGEYETLSSGLECISSEAFKAIIFDKDPTNKELREDFVKNILLMSDNGFEISDNEKIDKEILKDIQIVCDKYRKDNTPAVLRFLENVFSSFVGGISCLVTGVLSTLAFMASGGKIGIQMWSPVTPPWLKEKRYQELFQSAQQFMQLSAQVLLLSRGGVEQGPEVTIDLHGGTQHQLDHKLRDSAPKSSLSRPQPLSHSQDSRSASSLSPAQELKERKLSSGSVTEFSAVGRRPSVSPQGKPVSKSKDKRKDKERTATKSAVKKK